MLAVVCVLRAAAACAAARRPISGAGVGTAKRERSAIA
jgi:hypothetical protein